MFMLLTNRRRKQDDENITLYYFRNIQGTIDFDKRKQDTMTGVFSFFAEDSLLKKSIIVKNGIFKFIKKV